MKEAAGRQNGFDGLMADRFDPCRDVVHTSALMRAHASRIFSVELA